MNEWMNNDKNVVLCSINGLFLSNNEYVLDSKQYSNVF